MVKMYPEIKSLELDGQEQGFLFEKDVPFCILMECEIGARGSVGADLFRFSVCNQQWLTSQSRQEPNMFLSELRLLLVDEFDLNLIQNQFQDLLDEIVRGNPAMSSWKELAMRVHPYAEWEYFEETVRGL